MKGIGYFLDYLYKLERTGIKYSLKNIKLLMKELGNPQERLKCIHIAGTNGKGAVASFTASILTEHGLRTGLFTSPHILKFNERIRINGRCISDSYIKNFIRNNRKLIESVKPSFFEVNTALAFTYFADKNIDAAVIETGLGGRLDSTNIIKPLAAIITEIGVDHTEYLGNTLEEIAEEKTGILKPGVDAFISDDHKDLRKLFRKKVKRSNFFFLDDYIGYQIKKTNFDGSTFRVQLKKKLSNLPGSIDIDFSPIKREIFSIPLPGEYQVRNSVTSIISSINFLKKSDIDSSVDKIKNGLLNVKTNSGYRCRFEYVKNAGKHYIFDISHNPDGISAAVKTASQVLRKFKKRIVIFAMMREKDYKSAIDILLDFSNVIIFTKPEYERALPPDILFKYASESHSKNKRNFYAIQNVSEALRKAKKLAGKEDVIVIIGSFFLVSDAIKELGLQKKMV